MDLGSSTDVELASLAGRSSPERADSRDTRARLVDAVRQWVADHGAPPERLADIAAAADVSTATAYRHFASVDDAIQAFVLQLPTRAVELFAASPGDDPTPVDAFRRWNRCWVRSCLEHGALAVHLRSRRGFLERRDAGDPVIGYLCRHLEPVLDALGGDTTMLLFTWNVLSDPREVLDLQRRGWSGERIADFVTDLVTGQPVEDPPRGRRPSG